MGQENITFAAGYASKGEQTDQELINKAIENTKTADIVIICAGLQILLKSKDWDREHMNLPKSHDALINAVADAHGNVVVALSNGSPVEMPMGR